MKEEAELFDDLVFDGKVGGCVPRGSKAIPRIVSEGKTYRLVIRSPGRRVYEQEKL